MAQFIYKILTAEEWDKARHSDTFAGVGIDLEDGFIHFSTAEQVPGTLARFFAGRDDLVLLAIDLLAVGNELKWEPASTGEVFPHLYGTLELAAVRAVHSVELDADGTHRVPDLGE